MLKKVEWEVRIVNVWDYRCRLLAYKMMVNKFDKFEAEHDIKKA